MRAYGRYSRRYLERARARLDEQRFESLFYAALELRCGIEARMKEYLAAQKEVSTAKKQGWRIAILGKSLETAFRTGDQVIQITILHPTTREPLEELYYTPVTRRLQKMAERLGEYLHAASPSEEFPKGGWADFREFLEKVWLELNKATAGTLLGAPLNHTKTHQLKMTIGFESVEEQDRYLQRVGNVGARAILQVAYLDDLPAKTATR